MPEHVGNLNVYTVAESCTACDGKGKITVTVVSSEGLQTTEQDCKTCDGTGTIAAGTITTPVSD